MAAVTASEIHTLVSDPDVFSEALEAFPNPDIILQNLGESASEVYKKIMSDTHVIGVIQPIRSALISHEWKIQTDNEDSKAQSVLELCQKVFNHKPAPKLSWSDIIWQIAESRFHGYRGHEIVWTKQENSILPAKIKDVPNRVLISNYAGNFRVRTKNNDTEGEAIPEKRILLTRHMPDSDNPYGIAILSTCYWAYYFKRMGFKHFAQLCERYAIPKTFGHYPLGTSVDEQKLLLESLTNLTTDSVAVAPEGNSVEIIEPKSQGEPQAKFIEMCNAEISKAILTSTLSTEINGQGSRAAAQTHFQKENLVYQSTLKMISDTLTELCAWITEVNFGPETPSPKFIFFQKETAQQAWLEFFEKGRYFLDIPVSFAHEKCQVPFPKKGEKILTRGEEGPSKLEPKFASAFSTNTNKSDNNDPLKHLILKGNNQFQKQFISKKLNEIRALVNRSKSLTEIREGLAQLYKNDENAIKIIEKALLTGKLFGIAEAKEQEDEGYNFSSMLFEDEKKKSFGGQYHLRKRSPI